MPKLAKVETEKIFLPSTENEANEADKAYVEIKKEALGGDMMNAAFGANNVERTAKLIASLIVAWNFTDDEGNPEPITSETVARLQPEDFSVLAIRASDIAKVSKQSKLPQDGEKKTTSIDTSMPSTTPIVPQT